MIKTIQEETKFAIAEAVITGDKTKKAIATDFGVSTDSVRKYGNLYAEKLKARAEQKQAEQVTKLTERESPVFEKSKTLKSKGKIPSLEGLNENQCKIVEDYYASKGAGVIKESRIGKKGRPKAGVRSIKIIIMDILDEHYQKEQLIKDNRSQIIKQIASETGHTEAKAKKYFSCYKRLFGGYQYSE